MKAFTIVELVIVITVVGILTAVTVIGYNGYQNSVKNAQAKNILGDTHKNLNAYKRSTGSYPILLSSIEVKSEEGLTVAYDPLDSIGWFCLSVSIDGTDTSYYSTSLNSAVQDGDCDSIDVVAGKPAGFVDDPQDTDKITSLDTPLSGHPDITYYVVFDVSNTASDYERIAGLTPEVNGNRFTFFTMATGVSDLRYRIDTSAHTNAFSVQTGVRTAGRHIGWLQVKNDVTVREFAYDKSSAHVSESLLPGSGWEFTSITLNAASSSQKGVAAVVYNAAHNETTRKLIMTWLADKYSVPLSF